MGNDIEKEVKEMLATITGLELEDIDPRRHIVRDLGVDSLKVIEIATAIERKYAVTVKENQMAKIKTVEDAIKLIEELVKKKNKKE